MEQIEKQFITSYQSNLAKKGKEICEEILVMIGEKDEMMMEKAKAFCEFFCSYDLDGVNTENLLEKCQNYIDDLNNFYKYRSTFDKVNINRREKERWLDRRSMRLKEK